MRGIGVGEGDLEGLVVEIYCWMTSSSAVSVSKMMGISSTTIKMYLQLRGTRLPSPGTALDGFERIGGAFSETRGFLLAVVEVIMLADFEVFLLFFGSNQSGGCPLHLPIS